MEVTQTEGTILLGTELETEISLTSLQHLNQVIQSPSVVPAQSQTRSAALVGTSVVKGRVIVIQMRTAWVT